MWHESPVPDNFCGILHRLHLGIALYAISQVRSLRQTAELPSTRYLSERCVYEGQPRQQWNH